VQILLTHSLNVPSLFARHFRCCYPSIRFYHGPNTKSDSPHGFRTPRSPKLIGVELERVRQPGRDATVWSPAAPRR